MLEIIRCQANLFGNFSKLETKNELIMKLLEGLSDYKFIPNIINEMNLEIINGVPNQKMVKRLQLISEEDLILVEFLSNTIAVNLQKKQSNEVVNVKLFFDDSKKIFKKILEVTEFKANRLSLIVNHKINDVDGLYSKYIIDSTENKAEDIVEWNLRRAKKEHAPSLGENEEIYVISNVSKGRKTFIDNSGGSVKINDIDGEFIDVDINTVPKSEERFGITLIDKFIELAKTKYTVVIDEIGGEKCVY